MNDIARRPVGLLITDLDNTLYDWVGSFVPAFYAMVDVAADILGIDPDVLLDELRLVHQRHGSVEHPFALLEAETVARKLEGKSRDEGLRIFDPAFHRFNSVRKSKLVLYEGVIDTLSEVAATGVSIVAYTDARIPNSLFRLNKLRLDRFIGRLYAPAARFPNNLAAEAPNEYLLRVLPEMDKKPNPKTLLHICRDLGVAPHDAVYVGDSLSRDIYMAQSAGVRSAWARYGTNVDPELWRQLVRVTHWTEQDVESEVHLKIESAGSHADVVLDRFSELREYFTFTSRLSAGQ